VTAGPGPGPGPLGEEAARLLDALGAWARGNLHRAPGASQDGHESWHEQMAGGPGEAISDGSPACRLCPVCQLIAVLRSARPETFAHLLEASAALTAALRSLVEYAEADADRERRRSGLQHIDLDPPARDRPGFRRSGDDEPGGAQEAAPA